MCGGEGGEGVLGFVESSNKLGMDPTHPNYPTPGVIATVFIASLQVLLAHFIFIPLP